MNIESYLKGEIETLQEDLNFIKSSFENGEKEIALLRLVDCSFDAGRIFLNVCELKEHLNDFEEMKCTIIDIKFELKRMLEKDFIKRIVENGSECL